MACRRCLWVFGSVVLLLGVFLMWSNGVLAAEKSEIVIGAINSTTGHDAMGGTEQKWAYEQAVADINKKGGVFVKELKKKLPLKLVFADDSSAPDQAAAAMERLIRVNKVDFALSGDTTEKNLAAATISEKYKVLFLIDLAWPEMVDKENYKWTASFFFSPVGAARVPFQIWDSLPEAEKIKRPALITRDSQDGQAFRETFQHWAKEHGYQFAMDNPAPEGCRDFSSYILKMKSVNADALLCLVTPSDGITLMRQVMEQQGLKLRYVHGWQGFWPTEFYKTLGAKSDYVIHDGFWTENNGAPGRKSWGGGM